MVQSERKDAAPDLTPKPRRDTPNDVSDRSITMKDTASPRRSQRPVPDCACGSDHKHIIASMIGRTDSGCWEWTGLLSPDGYGDITHAGRRWRAHRLSYIAFVGPIPEGLVLDHLCRNKVCVNPAHLDPTTSRINVLRGIGPSAKNFRKTNCIRGHALQVLKPGQKYRGACLTCQRLNQAAKIRTTVLSADDPRHGSINGYGNLGCRCQPCRDANAAYHLAYIQKRRTNRPGEVTR
jgi:hypothetical protein